MGLSGDTDPTRGLPPVDGSGEDVDQMDKADKASDAVVAPLGSVIERIDAETLIVNDVIDTTAPPGDKATGKRKISDHDEQQAKRFRVSDEAEGSVVGRRASRPKKLVASRDLGLLNRRQIRQKQRVEHSGSSSDEYEVHPETGEKRRRVGFLFKTAPRPILPNFLTADDEWKLEGCTIPKRLKRVERVAGMVCFAALIFYIFCQRACFAVY